MFKEQIAQKWLMGYKWKKNHTDYNIIFIF